MRQKINMSVSTKLAVLPSLLLLSCLPRLGGAPPEKDVLVVVPHTHWEGAVFKTREEYLDIGLPHILQALSLLGRYPGYRFVLDQMCYVKPFLDRYPSEEAAFRELLKNRRLEIAGGTDTMHDTNVPSGESLARQFLIGKWFFRDRLGYEVKTGWGLDSFGHNAQMPQILKLAGLESYWFQRGVPSADTPSEFLWQGLDGAKIPAFWLPNSYAGLYDSPRDLPAFEGFVRSRFDALQPYSRGYGRVLLAGADVSEPEPQLPPFIDQLERAGSLPFSVRFGLPSDFAALIAAHRTDRPIISGELNPVFQGGYSTRIDVKQWMRELERTLTSAEKASVLAHRLATADREAIERAWEPVLFNEAHDASSGVLLDKVYDEAVISYRYAQRLGVEILNSNLDNVVAGTDTRGPGSAIVIFNLLGWPRTDIAQAEIGIREPSVRAFTLLDESGQAVPYQILKAEQHRDGGIASATIAFVARDVPAMGHLVYHLANGPAPAPALPRSSLAAHGNSNLDDSGFIENEFYKAVFNLWNGQITSLILKPDRWETLSAPGNVVAREEDGGDLWQLYGTLNGARFTAMREPIPAPRPNFTRFSSDYVGGNGSATAGPVFAEFRIDHPFGQNHFSTRVRMYPGVRRIDIHTEIFNQEQFVRYRVQFPTSIHGGQNVQEIAFGAIERPHNQEFPAQNWIDYSGAAGGIALLNRGLPGSNVAGDTMLLSLARSTRLLSYEDVGGPGQSSDSALELGKRLSFDYAVVPHTGTWQAAQIYRAGLEFNNPLVVRPSSTHPGALPKRWGLLEVSNPQAVVSALKPARQGEVALRIYEATGQPARGVRVRLAVPLKSVRDANLIEDPGQALKVEGNAFSFDLRPYEIKTFLLQLKQD